MSFRIPHLAALALAFASVVAHAQDQIRTDLDTVARAIVAVDATIADRALLGAGVVAMRERDAVIVVTANHVVRQGATEASRILVRFKDRPQQALAATLLPGFDRTDDIAAFRVEHLREQGVDPCALPLPSFDSVQVVRRGHGVFPIGNPAGVAWRIPVTPDTVTEVAARAITFQSALIDSGHSGGGLFNAYGDLVGIIRADQPPYGVATRADRAWALLRGWVPASVADTCAAASAAPAPAAAAPVDATRAALAQQWIDDPAFRVELWRPLLVAVRDGDVEAVRRLTTREILNPEYGQGPYPLHLAAELGQIAVVKQLILMGAKKNEYLSFPAPGDTFGARMGTPLYMAVRANQVETIRLLIASCAFVNDDTWEGGSGAYSPLATAAAQGRLEAAQVLIAAGARLTSQHGSRFAPIGQAVIHGHIDMIELLRRAGASLATPSSATDALPYTSLAVQNDQLGVLRYLLSARAPVTCTTSGYGCATPVLEALSTSEGGELPPSRLQALQMLLAAGANPNGDGWSNYIAIAITEHKPAALKVLLRAGANPNAKDRDGKTMLEVARAADDNDAVAALRAFGATR